MTNELARQQKCIVLRNGLEIWVDKDKAEKIEDDWINGRLKGPFKIDGRTLNTADISAFALPQDMTDLVHRKNGEWKCKSGTWHSRGEKCECASNEEKKYAQLRQQAIEACGKCSNGWIQTDRGMAPCECVVKLNKKLTKKQ